MRNRRSGPASVLFLLFAAGSTLWARHQEFDSGSRSREIDSRSRTQTQQPPVFRSTTDIVHSQVVVRNERGDSIPGLTPKDFEIYEDGVRQSILTFLATSGGRVMTEITPQDEKPREGIVMPRSSRTNEAPGRVLIIFIDDLHLQHGDTAMAVQVLKLIRDTIVHENDLIGLVSTGYASISSEVGPDPQHRRFDQALGKVMGAAPSYSEIIHGAQTMDGPSGLRFNAGTAFRTAGEIVDQAARITNRRKAFIYVSSGYDFNPLADSRYQALQDQYALPPAPGEVKRAFSNPLERGHLQFSEADLVTALGELVRRAVRANVTFYAVDPRGLIAGPPAGLDLGIDEWTKMVNTSLSSIELLSDGTGGFCICRTNDFKAGLQRIDNDMSDYYMIGYQSTNVDPMKIRRRIEIKVLRPGAKAIYPDSYTIKR